MTVKITIERTFTEDPFPEGLRAINKIKMKEMQQKGYVRGDTLLNLDHNRELMVLSVWSSIDDWKTWENSIEKHQLENELIPQLEKPVRIRAFITGIDDMAKVFKSYSRESQIAL